MSALFCPRLIEVALPIREISAESVRDKSLRHGHISTLHLWWARRPLAASRGIVFASLVPDPDDPQCLPEFRKAVERLLRDKVPGPLKAYRRGREWITDADPYRPYDGIPDTPRNRLLTFIAKWSPEKLAFDAGKGGKELKPAEVLDERSLVKWETSDPQNAQGREVLRIARELVTLANHGQPPTVLDPFSGGGAIPLEATRLGCQAIANDYNPVAYIILRATCEFPQKYGQRLIRDVEHWAKWILERVRQRIGHLYPPGGDGQPIVGYLWARTAPCSNPACRAEIPLLRSLLVCNKDGKQVALTMKTQGKEITFGIAKNKQIQNTDGTLLKGGDCRCPICKQVTDVKDVRRAGLQGYLGERPLAVITETPSGKNFRVLEPTDLEALAKSEAMSKTVERPTEYVVPEINAPGASPKAGSHRSISIELYGFKTFASLFNPR